jgi:D-alanine-D-alanine ligase
LAKERLTAVLMGGEGAEREVSLESGRCVAEALKSVGEKIIEADIRADDLSVLENSDVDIFFLALHGEFGEDGKLQQILEERGLTFTGSGSEASERTFDKVISKEFFSKAGISTPEWFEINDINISDARELINSFGGRMVVKPVCQGSSVDIDIIDDVEAAASAVEKCVEKYGRCLVEKFIKGRELTISILDGESLDVIEIVPKREFYNYQAKYEDDTTEYLFGTISEDMEEKLAVDSMMCFEILGCRDYARVDFMMDETSEYYVLEVNTLPGMTSHSLLPKAAEQAGMSFGQMCVKIIELAEKNFKLKI